ncbi:MAG TPA: helix-turn-helix domain-containing protein [Ktedonobacteraceae bacterium]|nr:helix-turn-helix domain-containing protein [Ktedonobacteraceae bacterium]
MNASKQSEKVNEVQAIRALAHPLRLKLLDLLRFEGPSTATLLGQRLGESSGATSYHLRQLARYGFVAETPSKGKRERWWRYQERKLMISVGETSDREERTLLAELLSREAHALDRFLAARSHLGEWDEVAFFQSRGFRLTVEELEAVRKGIEDVLAPLRRADASDVPADALPVRILAFGFPLPLEEK